MIMPKAKVLFFAADPFSAPPLGSAPRLLLDEDFRHCQDKVRESGCSHTLELSLRPAARAADLRRTLRDRRPTVVHFSGHGGKDGLIVVGPDGSPHSVPRAALTELFELCRGDIRLVVLNACFSLAQAKEIAEVVGCAIGTQDEISDTAAICFSGEFYGQIACGQSVASAFRHARNEVALHFRGEEECLQLETRSDVDPEQLRLISANDLGVDSASPGAEHAKGPASEPRRSLRGVLIGGTATLAFVTVVVLVVIRDGPARPKPLALQSECGFPAAASPRALMDGSTGPLQGSVGGIPSDLAQAKLLYRLGRYTEAAPIFKRAAERGDVEAMTYLGIIYLRERGSEAHSDSAIDLLRRAAGKGDARAMTALAAAYQQGDGVGRNLSLAEHWYTKAANHKAWPEAMWALGGLYAEEENYPAALDSYRNAVRAGWVDARVDAGMIYENSRGVTRDLDEARCLYRTAADAGSARGMVELGRLYLDGVGVARDTAEAIRWYRQAKAAGSPEAAAKLDSLTS
jgi:TPR repeat protein